MKRIELPISKVNSSGVVDQMKAAGISLSSYKWRGKGDVLIVDEL